MATVPAPEQGAIPVRVLMTVLEALKSARIALASHGDRVAVDVASAEGALEFHVQNVLPPAVAINRDPTQ